MMNDRMESWLSVQGIEAACVIGVTERERSMKQRVVIDVEIGVGFDKVSRSDPIGDTVDYRQVSRRVQELVTGSSFQLVESPASHIRDAVFGEFPRVETIRVEVWKPGALRGAWTVGAGLRAQRELP